MRNNSLPEIGSHYVINPLRPLPFREELPTQQRLAWDDFAKDLLFACDANFVKELAEIYWRCTEKVVSESQGTSFQVRRLTYVEAWVAYVLLGSSDAQNQKLGWSICSPEPVMGEFPGADVLRTLAAQVARSTHRFLIVGKKQAALSSEKLYLMKIEAMVKEVEREHTKNAESARQGQDLD
jgi:hypothetical protein